MVPESFGSIGKLTYLIIAILSEYNMIADPYFGLCYFYVSQ